MLCSLQNSRIQSLKLNFVVCGFVRGCELATISQHLSWTVSFGASVELRLPKGDPLAEALVSLVSARIRQRYLQHS